MIITVFFLLSMILFVNIYQGRKSLHMLQQNLYNENNRYGKWIVNNLSQFKNIIVFAVLISIVGALLLFKIQLVSSISMWMISILLCLHGMKLKRNQLQEKKTAKKI